MEEIWKTIKSYPTHEVSNTGKIRGKERYVNIRDGRKRKVKSRIISTHFNKITGYECVCLKFKGKTEYVHRFIAEAFIENPFSKKTVNHKNGIKSDNRIENLEWATQSENILHAFRTGLSSGKNRVKRKFRKLNPTQVKIIKECFSMGFRNKEIADYFKVNNTLICNIKSGIIWRSITI